MTDEEDRINKAFLAEFVEDWVQMPWMGSGGRTVLWNPNLPFMDLNRLPSISPRKTFQNLLPQTTPFIKIPVEQIMNWNVFWTDRL